MGQLWNTIDASDIASGTIAAARLPTLAGLLHNVGATVDPTFTDDSSAGYWYASLWHNRLTGVTFQCQSPSVSAAAWVPLNPPKVTTPASGQWLTGPQTGSGTYGGVDTGIRLVPWFTPPGGLTLSELDFEVTTAGAAGSVTRVIVMADSGAFWPRTTWWDSGAIATTTTGVKAVTGTIPLPGTVAWIGLLAQGGVTAPAFRGWSTASGYTLRDTAGTAMLTVPRLAYIGAGYAGAMPASVVLSAWTAWTSGPALTGRVA